eukprot:CAMPEP_0181176518 /NCGR_PEP_ID=MMETSP1096-20121128/4673_1 /TAXON_ID=156174 ORGANISM="Chrysochromulina ericina, Strain CCMP281" /NCGR_SAMPLE_ID=MMETSP1096 /ASSEMBLY_ACC=CAM_ASM_000453 /LENGTH=352 /DNA_ID=CAMNT_0023264613 /DNA_START=38 /DNA_END=1093 /DNA_ORIENTATION=-
MAMSLKGNAALYGPQGGAASVAQALTDSVLLRFSTDDFAAVRRSEPALMLQLLLAIIRQGGLLAASRQRVLPCKETALVALMRSSTSDTDSLACPTACPLAEAQDGACYHVELTGFQKARFDEIFDLVDDDGSNLVSVSELQSFLATLGHSIPTDQLHAVIKRYNLFPGETSGIEESSREFNKEQFREFIRQILVSDISLSLYERLKSVHAAAVERGVVDRKATVALLASIGIQLPDNIKTEELLDVMDADGSGDIDFEELLVGIGMLKRQTLEWSEIKTIFDDLFHHNGKVGHRDLNAEDFSMLFNLKAEEAEELVFLADKDRFNVGADEEATGDADEIDLAEFYQMILEW